MPTPARILRAMVQRCDRDPPIPTARQCARDERILALGETLMADSKYPNLTFAGFASALQIAPATLRYHFTDLDMLLGEILNRHLQAIEAAFAAIPPGAPDRPAKCRAAYLTHTRTPYGALTNAHLLFIRDRHCLPDDVLDPIETMRQTLGATMAGPESQAVLMLLDNEYLAPSHMEAMLAALTAAKSPPAQPQPVPALTLARRSRSKRQWAQTTSIVPAAAIPRPWLATAPAAAARGPP